MASDPGSTELSAEAAAAALPLPDGFFARYRRLLVFKSVDVEEPVDMFFHRPLAAAFAALVVGFPITPNQVTYASLCVGLAGSVFLYRAAFLDVGSWNYAVAGLLLFASVILDCADGQIARAKGGGSRLGRILDGIVDMLVLLPAWIILGFGVARHRGSIWIALGLFAGFSSWARIVIYDRVKSIYLAHTQPSSANGTESRDELEAEYAEIRARGFSFDLILMFTYVRVLMRVQDRFAPGSAHAREIPPEERQAFRERHGLTMRACSWMGLGTHMLLLYVAVFIRAWWSASMAAAQLVFSTVFLALLIVVLVRSRALRAE